MAVNATLTFAIEEEFDFSANLIPVSVCSRKHIRNNLKLKQLEGVDHTQLLGIGAAEYTLSGTYYPGAVDPFIPLRDAMNTGTVVSLYIYGQEIPNLLITDYEDTGLEFYSEVPQAVEWVLTLREAGAIASTIITLERISEPRPPLRVLEGVSEVQLLGGVDSNMLVWNAAPEADFTLSGW